MNEGRQMSRSIRVNEDGVNIAGDVDITIASNVGRPGRTEIRSRSTKRVVQRGRRMTKRTTHDGRDDGANASRA